MKYEGKKVGLEVKSKQTTCAQTSLYTMQDSKEDHEKQVITYSILYDVNTWLITYVNASKKAWSMTEEEFEKTPDIRVFEINVTEEMKNELLNKFADIVKRVRENDPPKLDLSKWRFNNFKTACAKDLSEEEYQEVKDEVQGILRGNYPDWLKDSYLKAFEFIKEVREVN